MEWNLSIELTKYKRFFKNGILLDNGPLMLLFFGEYDRKHNTNYLKKESYNLLDYDALLSFLQGCPKFKNEPIKLIITPHILTEFYKHARDDFEDKLEDFFVKVNYYLKSIEEKHVNKDYLIDHEHFMNLQIGEVSLFCLCEPEKHNQFQVILHHDKGIDLKLKRNKNILTINLVDHVIPWHLTHLSS